MIICIRPMICLASGLAMLVGCAAHGQCPYSANDPLNERDERWLTDFSREAEVREIQTGALEQTDLVEFCRRLEIEGGVSLLLHPGLVASRPKRSSIVDVSGAVPLLDLLRVASGSWDGVDYRFMRGVVAIFSESDEFDPKFGVLSCDLASTYERISEIQIDFTFDCDPLSAVLEVVAGITSFRIVGDLSSEVLQSPIYLACRKISLAQVLDLLARAYDLSVCVRGDQIELRAR